MKSNATFDSSFLFNPEVSMAANWTTVRQPKPRRRALSLVTETQIDHKQEFICGIILILCLLFSLSVFFAQVALA